MDPAQVSYEDYVAMCGCVPVMGFEGMLAHYRITMAHWTAIATQWNGVIATNPQYMQHGMRVEQEAGRIRSGGAPRPVSAAQAPPPAADGFPAAVDPSMHAVSGAMPGAVPVKVPSYGGYGPPAPGYAPQPPQQQPVQAWQQQAQQPYQPPYQQQPQQQQQPQPQPQQQPYPPQQQPYPPQQQPYPQQGYPQQPAYNQQAANVGNEIGNAFSAFGSAVGSLVHGAVGTFAVGTAVLVQWSDGNRYPATVTLTNAGQVQVAFPDGRQVWVPSNFVVAR